MLQEVKAALKELPPGERVVALALKNIYEKISQIHEQERNEIEQNHLSFISQFKEVEDKVTHYVNVGCPHYSRQTAPWKRPAWC